LENNIATLHTFGCSLTQGHALPDVLRPRLIAEEDIKYHWSDTHILAPSKYAWPKVLGDKLGLPVENYARRGACFQQIARQCAVASVPLTHLPVPENNFITRILPGFNKFFGLSRSENPDHAEDQAEGRIMMYMEGSMKYTFDNLIMYDRYHNNLVLQTMTDGYLRATGARVIHLSVEHQPYINQLEDARQALDLSLQSPYVIPNPNDWYPLSIDHDSCVILHDPSLPTAGDDFHPSIQHHINFANHIHEKHFSA